MTAPTLPASGAQAVREVDPTYPKPGRNITVRSPGCIMTFSPDFVMAWGGREYHFEWGYYGGPVWLRKDGDPHARQPGSRHPFWDGIEAWQRAGQKADSNGLSSKRC